MVIVSNNFMATHKTIFDINFQLVEKDLEYLYQSDLTTKLDRGIPIFNQEVINEIVLWKVNRYANLGDNTLNLINEIESNAINIDVELTRKVLKLLLQEKGIQLPMASTILRFKNKNIYQIIDQRVFRIIYADKKLKLKAYPSDKNLNSQIELYLQYLKDLTEICEKLKIPFEKSDRILYMADKRINKDVPLDNYSTKSQDEN